MSCVLVWPQSVILNEGTVRPLPTEFPPEAPRDCPLCPRLVAFRNEAAQREPSWFNGAVPSFGEGNARLLIVGLAPGLRGANRTGRPFTGDYAGDLLYSTLLAHGFARGTYRAAPDDGLSLVDCMITNAVRCVPPANKPTGAEIATCRRFLEDELAASPAPRVVLALGRIAWESVLRARGQRPARFPFAHEAVARPPAGPVLVGTYHTSRYNVNTGRLTAEMFERAVTRAAALLREPG